MFLLTAALVSAWAFARVNVAKAQEAVIVTLKENAEANEEKAARVMVERDQEREAKHALRAELAVERMKTDQTIVLKEIVNFHKDFADREVLFHELLRVLNTGRDEIALQIKTMESRLVGLIGEQTVALREITTAVVKSNGH